MGFRIKKEKLHVFLDIFRTLRWALGELWDFRGKLYIYIFILIAQAFYQLYLATKVGNIVDLALLDDMDSLLRTGMYFILLYIINIIISIISNRVAARNYNGMYNELELKVYRKIMDSSWEELTEYHSGDLITRLSSDIKTIAGNTGGLVPTMIAKLTLIALSAIYILFLDYSLIVVAVVISPVILVASRVFMGKIFDSQKDIKTIESSINSFNKETFNNIQAIKAFNLGNLFYGKMEGLENNRKKVDLRSNAFSLSSWAISFLAGLIGISVCIGWMFYRVHMGVISFGALSVLAFLTVQIADAMKTLLGLIPTVMEYMASAERVKKLLVLEDEEADTDPAQSEILMDEAAQNGVSIVARDMYFKYRNGYSVFEGASMRADPGEIVALVGPSGEGKTTMLRIILGIVSAQVGEASAVVAEKSYKLGKKTRSVISYVPQGNTMMAGSIMENMKLVKQDATDEEIKEALKTACIYDFVKKLPDGPDHVLGENGLGFSEGQNQRLSIARALLKDSPVLLMDEATSALDVATERKILDNIMKKNPKKTIVLTTHRPTVLSLCDRVYRIANKKIGEIGQEDIQKLMDEF